MLRLGGRLVFFLPTVTEDYSEVDVKSMLCERMEVTANSLQDFGSWGRRMSSTLASNGLISDAWRIAYHRPQNNNKSHRRLTFAIQPEDQDASSQDHIPAHKDFQEKYFKDLKKDTE